MMKHWKKQTEHRCFTLVELVVALGILMSVTGLIGMASVTFYRGWDSARRHSLYLQEYHAIDVIMDSCVRGMIPFTWNDEANETDSDLVFDGQPDSIHFVALRRSYGKDDSALLFLKIRLDEENQLIAEYSNLPRFPWTPDGTEDLPVSTEVLASGVRSVSFLYAGITSGNVVEWVDTWDREEDAFLPIAVQMTVEWDDGRREQWLRRTTGASSNSYCYEKGEITL